MTTQEKLDLYKKAKESYYNGQEIMTDLEFDTLEKELGLENKSYVGTRHNPSYTIRHPFVMGSLSKVQIHEKNGAVDWGKHYKDIAGFVTKYNIDPPLIITPKYDGCSFEIYVNVDYNEITISTRGDGSYGRDIYDHIIDKIPQSLLSFDYHEYVLRGEVLVKKSVFEQKYSDQFTNPRSFVAGVLASDYSDSWEFNDKLNDLDIVIYDFRIKVDENDEWIDKDWTELTHLSGVKKVLPEFYVNTTLYTFNDELQLKELYNKFDAHRKNSEYALDGFVIKPIAAARKLNLTEARPKDCVAIKFIPMLEETEVVNITWNLGKTGEYIPIIWVKPVEMDGRMVQKCSGHNYGLLLEKNVGVGSKIIMSLAGDIIPFLYKVTQTGGDIPMPENYTIDGIHLMANLSEEEIARKSFTSSAGVLNIPNIGGELANKIFDYYLESCTLDAEFFGEDVNQILPTNILECKPEEIFFAVKNTSKSGAEGNARKVMKSFKEVLDSLTLKDIIKSFNFKLCGDKLSQEIANYLLGLDYDFSSKASEGYAWALDKDSDNMKKLIDLLAKFGKTIDDYKEHAIAESNKSSEQIPVILTGNPNNYKSKGEFMQHHPEYRLTGSWKEVKIVFTNNLESNTGKMKKARANNIEIRLY